MLRDQPRLEIPNEFPPERLDSTVDPKLLEILVCPITKGPLEFDASRQELISRSAKLAYPIRDGIPIMLPEEAQEDRLTRPTCALHVIARSKCDEAIHLSVMPRYGLLRYARNDG